MLPEPNERPVDAFDPNDSAVCADPFPTYRWLLDHHPLYRTPGQPFWVLSRWDDVQGALRDHEAFSSELGLDAEIMSLVVRDPPDHDRLRRTVNRVFTPRRVAELEPRIAARAEELVAAAPDEVDFAADLADALAIAVICDLLGVPFKRRKELKRWSRDALLAGVPSGVFAGAAMPEHSRGRDSLLRYLAGVVAAPRRAPRDNLLGELLRAEAEGAFRGDELVHFACLLFIAGHETTANLISSGAAILASDPDLWRRLQERPEDVPRFVEETLRCRSPLQRIVRRTTHQVELHGTTIPPGSFVMLLLGAANRDAARFPDPDRFDLDRDASGHQAFGNGIHFCLGAALARLEARVAFTVLLGRCRGLRHHPTRTAVPISAWGSGNLGWDELPLVLER